MEAQLTEPLTYPSQSYAASFFSVLPRDARFINTVHHKFQPTSSIDVKTITFSLPRYESPSVYNFNEACLEVTCAIVTHDGQTPASTKSISVCNNVLHSLFEIWNNLSPIRNSDTFYFDHSRLKFKPNLLNSIGLSDTMTLQSNPAQE